MNISQTKKVSTRLTFFILYESQTIFDSQTTKIKSQTLLENDNCALSRDMSLPLGMNILSYGRRIRHLYV